MLTTSSEFVHKRRKWLVRKIERVRKIAIVGSGIVGLIAAHALRRHRYDVTLYSDRTVSRARARARFRVRGGRAQRVITIGSLPLPTPGAGAGSGAGSG